MHYARQFAMPISRLCSLALTLAATAAAAQVRLPGTPLLANPVAAVGHTFDNLQSQTQDALSGLHQAQIERLVRANRRSIDTDADGNPIVRSEVLALSLSAVALANARSQHFTVVREPAMGIGELRITVLSAPEGMSTKKALQTLRAADPAGSYDYNDIYFGSGSVDDGAVESAAPSDVPRAAAVSAAPAAARQMRVGLLDTGIDVSHPAFQQAHIHTWGCGGKPVAAEHGTAVASLLIGHAGKFSGVQPAAELFAADVYCGQPAGGAADALAAAFAWLQREGVAVINVSLVGPKNLVLERVVAALTSEGYLIVAAVGNDGPAAPPLYPAAYPHVVGVTGVDAHRRVLIEAAHGPQVMFASPGADLAAAAERGGFAAVRGTSFAAPIVAGILAERLATPDVAAANNAIGVLANSAIDLGSPGRDLTYGFGLVGAEFRMDPTALTRR